MDFLNGSFRIGRFLGITVRIHILFVIWMGFRLFSAGEDWRYQLLFMSMLFGIVLIHEFGHCLGARSVGGDAEDILLWPLGGLAYAHAPMRPWPQFVTVACGPLVNVIFCVVSAAILIATTGHWDVVPINPLNMRYSRLLTADWQIYLHLFYVLNFYLLCFNLLPIYPMDGGQLFFTIIWPFLGINRATMLACQVGLAGAVLFGIYGLQSGQYMLLFIALFGGQTCWQRLVMAKHGMVFDERIGTYDHIRRQRGDEPVVSWWRRMFGRRSRTIVPPAAKQNPNPGGWEKKLSREDHLESEVDRILQKVHDQGINSLSYVERQTLERATRERREREQEV